MFSCSTCRGPITGTGLTGRPWPGRTAARYCCYGCLSLGEQEQHEATSTAASRWKLDGIAIRLGLSLLIVGQSMIFGLALNLHDDVPADVRWFTQTLILGGTLLVAALLGGPLLQSAWQELRRGRLTIEALFLLTIAGAMRRCKDQRGSPPQPAATARRASGRASANRSSSLSGATLTLMQRFRGSTPGMRTKMPRAIRASSTRLAKGPSRPQSMVTKLVAEGRGLRPCSRAIVLMRSRARLTLAITSAR